MMGEKIIYLRGRSKKHCEQKIKEASWIIKNMFESGDFKKWFEKWCNWKTANAHEAEQIIEQLPEYLVLNEWSEDLFKGD